MMTRIGQVMVLAGCVVALGGCGSSSDETGDPGRGGACVDDCVAGGFDANDCQALCVGSGAGGTSSGAGGTSSGAGGTGAGGTATGGQGGGIDPNAPPDPFRYEPVDRVDFDNVQDSSFGDLQLLDLPEPPKSGFRLIMKPQDVFPGEDSSTCNSWPIPDTQHRWVYTSVVHNSPGLHHANLYGVTTAPEPYPNCNTSADLRMFGQVGAVKFDPASVVSCGDPNCTPSVQNPACDLTTCEFSGLTIPLVLFANSTQVTEGETFAFADGYAFEVPQGFEVVTDTHLQNTTPDVMRVEAAWDFYTMPVDQVTNPTAMFVWFWLDFLIPARSEHTLATECMWGGGDVVAIMPHAHQWATRFVTDFGNSPNGALNLPPNPGSYTKVIDAYDKPGTGLTDSDIQVYYPPIDSQGTDTVHFRCEYNNTLDKPMSFGNVENEMCFLFGYTSPVEAQRIGTIWDEQSPCESIDPHHFPNNPGVIENLP